MQRALLPGVVLLAVSALSCSGGTDGALQPEGTPASAPNAPANAPGPTRPTPLPEDVVALYDEAAVFKPGVDAKKEVKLNLTSLVQQSKVREAVVTPFDDDAWYEPKRVAVKDSMIVVDAAPKQDLLVVLDLGDTARNNYQVLSQMMAIRGLLPQELRPKICNLILCATETFKATAIPDRLPDIKQVRVDFKRVLADEPIGGFGRKSTICEQCLNPPANILPCLVWKCGGDIKFPIRRKILTRRNVYSLSPADLASYAAGVAAMKARPVTDPTSWLYQAKMHALNSGSAAALQDQCQHRQFFFFSWHRMYLYYFERIVRKASGNPNLTVPYWNYTDVAAQAALPDAFRTPANATNALYNSTRSAFYNAGGGLPPADVAYSSGFSLTNFTTSTSGSPSFGGKSVAAPAHFPSGGGTGSIEQSPHNNVHNDISGDMATGESPRDPIFWLHHSNIDRLWKKWIALGGGRDNPTSDTAWMTQTFTFFDENGAQKTFTGAQIVNTVVQLGYRYDDDPLVYWPYFWPYVVLPAPPPAPSASPAPAPAPDQQVKSQEPVANVQQPVRLTDKRQDVKIAVPQAARGVFTSSQAAKFAGERWILQLQDIQYDSPVGVSYMLFLNLPDGAQDPDQTNPSYIGTLGFFGKTETGTHAGMTEGGLSAEYDVTAVVQRLGSIDEIKLSAIPSYPKAPPDRPDLARAIAQLKPQGNPRFGRIILLKQKIE